MIYGQSTKSILVTNIEQRLLRSNYKPDSDGIYSATSHSFAMNLSFSHTLSPSAKSSTQLAFELLKTLATNQQQELKQQLSML